MFAVSLLSVIGIKAQSNTQREFWHEDFSGGKLPQGWTLGDSCSKAECKWIVTDQPYPGSFQFNQQAPPIASISRGFHIQYRPGTITNEDVTKWNQSKVYPSAYFQTGAIDCSAEKQVILKFVHTARWNDWFTDKDAGLYVMVSNDAKTWKWYNLTPSIPAVTSPHKPIQEEINITDVAAGKRTVYLRFYWKGIFSWYWMIDDIALANPLRSDLAVTELTSHKPEGNNFKKGEVIKVKVKNMGSDPVTGDVPLKLTVDDKTVLNAVLSGSKQPLAFNQEREVAFPATDLAGKGSHSLEIVSSLPGDQRPANDTLRVKLFATAMNLGNVSAVKRLADHEYEVASGDSRLKISFLRDDIFRVWLAPEGNYTNPAGDAIVVDYKVHSPKVTMKEQRDYYAFSTPHCVLRVYKSPLRMALYGADNKTLKFEELSPLTYGQKTYQQIRRQDDEYFFGGGMQNGRFSHRDSLVKIAVSGGWDDGDVPNPAPFMMSSKGWGAFRNTFSTGEYDFKATTKLSHDENRFDCFYFAGNTLKDNLNLYTDITGKPFMPAMWMLTMGDANCYNKPEQRIGTPQSTPDVLPLVADKYVQYDMPRGWILPNDGYGCGYVKLDSVVRELHKRGFMTGLWTENGVAKIATEVGTYGTRLCKLDVAWVGSGYDFALNGAKAAFEGIQNNSDARGFVWTVCGWAGTQRYATVWSGDQSANWKYIEYHIPTVVGSGLSAFNAATSDIDGIFGGSPMTYTRDLQWKVYTPILMTMSGWAPANKQPWVYGDPYIGINRHFLNLKMRMLPYQYTYCREAHTSGTPMVRAMVLEFPHDKETYKPHAGYQFMSGEWLMVAPVYTSKKWSTVRDSIYFPRGAEWYDQLTGEKMKSGEWLKEYKCNLKDIPVFVKAGAIIPMYDAMHYVWEKPHDHLTVELWPKGKTSFDLYEDDLLTRKYEQGEYAMTNITSELDNSGKNLKVQIHPVKGHYQGIFGERSYTFDIRCTATPKVVEVQGKRLTAVATRAAWESAASGYFYDSADRKGRLWVKVAKTPTDRLMKLEVKL